MRRQYLSPILASLALGILAGAAPRAQEPAPPANASKATPSYSAVSAAIAEITTAWEQPGAVVPESAPGWRAYFDALNRELAAYSAATDDRGRLVALGLIRQMDLSLWGLSWRPAIKVRVALDEWLTPRVRLAWAGRNLIDFVERQKAASPESAENHGRWVHFVGDDLASALAGYESARTVQARRAALKKLTAVLGSLRSGNRSNAWAYSVELQAAVDSLYNRPNLDASADLAALAPFLSRDVVVSGPVYRNGYVSQVTAGPKTGFGLLPSDEGIAFYNKQIAQTVTPITDFQQQLQQDKRGRKIAKLYEFGLTTSDNPELTITTILRPSTGLQITPSYAHSIGVAIGSAPIAGKGFGRGVLAVLGLNREKLTEKVRENAYPKIAQGVVQGAEEEAAERIPPAQEAENAKLRKVLIGDNTLAVRDFRITGLSFRSRPTNALIDGTIGHKANGDALLGADMPRPPALLAPEAGVSADVHLGSVLSNVVAGLLASEEVRGVENVMIVTKATRPDGPPTEGITVGKNVDYPTFLKQIEEARAANNPNTTALRIKKPAAPPEFATDSRGFLVILVRDFQMDFPAPPGGLLGGNTKALRFLIPTAEFVLSFHIQPAGPDGPMKVDAKVEDFVWGPGSKMQGLGDDDSKPTPIGPFQANIALATFRNKLQQTPINPPVGNLKLRGFDIAKVSPLDPSGWMRVVLAPNGEPINPPTQTVAPGTDAPAPPASASSPVAAR